MRLRDSEPSAWERGALYIEPDDEFRQTDFWKRKSSKYNYARSKRQITYQMLQNYVGLYKENRKHGYFSVRKNVLLIDEDRYSVYDIYTELLEFGLIGDSSEEAEFLIDYLLYYARVSGTAFVKIKTREGFPEFYSLIRKRPHTESSGYIYLEVDRIDYEDCRHLKVYGDDRLCIKDLIFLYELGFTVERDRCYYKLNKEGVITVDRRTALIEYPDFIECGRYSKYKRFSKSNYALIHYIIYKAKELSNSGLTLGYKLKGVKEELHRAKNKLITFKNFKQRSLAAADGYYGSVLLEIEKAREFERIDIFTERFTLENFYFSGTLEQVNIKDELSG